MDRNELGRHGLAGRILFELEALSQIFAFRQSIQEFLDDSIREIVEQFDSIVFLEARSDLGDPRYLDVLHELRAEVRAHLDEHVNGGARGQPAEQATGQFDGQVQQQFGDVERVPVTDIGDNPVLFLVANLVLDVGKELTILRRELTRLTTHPARDDAVAAVSEIGRHSDLPVVGGRHYCIGRPSGTRDGQSGSAGREIVDALLAVRTSTH